MIPLRRIIHYSYFCSSTTRSLSSLIPRGHGAASISHYFWLARLFFSLGIFACEDLEEEEMLMWFAYVPLTSYRVHSKKRIF